MIIDGKTVAEKRAELLKEKVSRFRKLQGFTPKLVAFLIGENPASKIYLSRKSKKAAEVGIESEIKVLPVHTDVHSIIQSFKSLNKDKKVTGILAQLPLPKDSPAVKDQREILDAIDPLKDVDCLTTANMGLLTLGQPRFYPATVKGVLTLLEEAFGLFGKLGVLRRMDNSILAGKSVTVIGRSDIVGKPLAIALINLGATVTVCNSKTKNLKEKTKGADILIAAAGSPKLVTVDMVKPGAIVIDVGINRVTSDQQPATRDQIVGDVDFENVSKVASAITPVPGGVGPMTIASLLENTLEAAKIQAITHTRRINP